MADYAAAPWGEMRADLQAGIVAATVANVNRKADSRAFAPSDFMPRFGVQEEAEPELAPTEFFAKVGA